MRIAPDQVAAQTAELREALAGLSGVEVRAGLDMPLIAAPRETLLELMRLLLRRGAFEHCSLLTAVDRFPLEPRFEVVYGLNSISRNRWARVLTRCPEDDPVVPSVTGIWAGAAWPEREAFDMLGVRFAGHPDLRRIYMPEGYRHHPLRKDFPRDGIEPDRLYREWDARRRRPEEER